MEISEVRVKLVSPPSDKLLAFCSITIDDDFVVRDLKVIGSPEGSFLAMPSRKLSDRCPRCSSKNHLRANYCNDCGVRLRERRVGRDSRGRARLHADIAHPINSPCRDFLQKLVMAKYAEELEKSRLPGYIPQELHEFVDFDDRSGSERSWRAEDAGGD